MKSYFEEIGVAYRREGDYLVPDVGLPETPHPIGTWGRQHYRWLRRNRPAVVTDLILRGGLYDYLESLNAQAQRMYCTVAERLRRRDGITEELKARDQMEWLRRTMTARAAAIEIVNTELIYC